MLERALADVLPPKEAKQVHRAFGYRTVGELLWHLPRRYSKRGELTPLTELPVGEHATVVAKVLDVQKRTMASRRGSILNVRVTDGNGFLSLTFFNQPWREKELRPGVSGQFSGKVSSYQGQLQLQNPDYELFADTASAEAAGADTAKLREAEALAFSKRPVPVYAASAAMPSWVVAKVIAMLLEKLDALPDPLPGEIVERAQIISFDQALRLVHLPESEHDYARARRSLKFREAFALQLAFGVRALAAKQHAATPRGAVDAGILAEFDAGLPYSLTGDQKLAGEVFAAELSRSYPMARLLQGEVGSGKTLVALRAMLQVADTAGQSALLAPTEVLAQQHYRSLCELLGPRLMARVQPRLLTGSTPTAEKRQTLLDVASGKSLLVVGTHALLSDTTIFADLGLVVVDEQHRFGVEQREALRRKGKTWPHLLAMTATPIPRTVALTVFGELEITTLSELPAGRAGITSFAVQVQLQAAENQRAWQRALEEIERGRQVYVVCPAISVGDPAADDVGGSPVPVGSNLVEQAAAPPRHRAGVSEVAAMLRARPGFERVRVAELTGAMSPADKDAVMQAFAAGEIDLLVATTVIEVGVNVPNASMMLVLEADRFGVSQLHQLRGRVGRGEHPGLCLFLTEAEPGSAGWERVAAVADTLDGFALAEFDLEQRREGDILGQAQSGGKSALRLLRVIADIEVIAGARDIVQAVLAEDPDLRSYPQLRELVTAVADSAEQLDKT